MIDDEEAFMHLNEYFLRNCNIQCPIEMALNGQDALDRMEEIKPDLILLDMQMPVMDGLEFLAKFSETPFSLKTKVFALTVSEKEEERKAALAYKFVYGFLPKPMSNQHVQFILKHFTMLD
jgi:CheY-like chemotaxis protein